MHSQTCDLSDLYKLIFQTIPDAGNCIVLGKYVLKAKKVNVSTAASGHF